MRNTHSSRRLVKAFLTTLVLPAVVLHLVSTYTSFRPGWIETILLYICLVVTKVKTVAGHKNWSVTRRAAKAGAQPLPKIKGKYPGNIDILTTMMRRFPNEPLGLYWEELTETYGNTFNINVLGGDALFTRDPNVIKAILTSTSPSTSTEPSPLKYVKGPWLDGVLGDLLGSGIFNADGKVWKEHRAMTRPYFAKDRITDFEKFVKHSDHLLEVIAKLKALPGHSLSHNNGAIEVQDLLGRFTLDTGIDFLLAGGLDSLGDLPQTSGVPHELPQSSRFLRDLWAVQEIFKNKNEEHLKVINSFVDKLVLDGLNKQRVVKGNEEVETLLDHLISETRDPKMLRDEVLNILLAARDTTQATLTASLYVLAKRPEICKRLRSEILAIVPKGATPTYEDVRDIRYLRLFLNEVLRLYPPVPFNVRTAAQDDVIQTEGKALFIPKGMRMSYAIYSTHRRTDLWGDDAEVFDPDRWSDDRLRFYKSNPLAYTPFSAGPRICLGQNFALNEASFALIKILSQYDKFDLALDCQPKDSLYGPEDEILLQSQITLFFKGGLWLRFNEAADEKL
ncbi:Cytochrome P450 monooxygenase [Microbotryomycetes sp. JL221]|nr:Cytochrome P450 monooxygenase [Microbotryomycetes sp. JL221]